jgi:hypothetical protein
MAQRVSVSDRQFSGQIQHVLECLRRIGCDKANTLYILTPAELVAAGISLPVLKMLSTTSVGVPALAEGGEPTPPPRLVSRLLEDKASHDIAFKLGVDLSA